jgi:hypothetical protein
MDIEQEIKKILLELGQNIKIHSIDNENSVIEIEYEKYTVDLMTLFRDYLRN